MSTSANSRLEKLFANKPRPPRPNLQTTSVHVQPGCQHNLDEPIEREDAGPGKIESPTTGVTDRPTAVPDADDSGEYEQLFSRKSMFPGLGERVPKCFNLGAPNTVELISGGKRASNSAAKVADSRSSEDGNTTPYTGNGRPLIGRFCPLPLVAKFPYKYMRDSDDRVSKQFFASNKFYNRNWDLYYLHPPESFGKDALVLLAFDQVQKLIDEINAAFQICLSVPPYPFTLDFYEDGTPKPALLGTSTSRGNVGELTALIPEIKVGHGECESPMSIALVRAYEAFHEKIEGALLATKGKSRKSQQTRATKLFESLRETRNQMNRAQRYFGLRPRSLPIGDHPDSSFSEKQHTGVGTPHHEGFCFDFLDTREPVYYAFEHQPVFISIDIESYERNHALITEIGISTLDTLDLVDLAPGDTGQNWIKNIRSRHFRIKGREHLVNTEFCIGDPNAFQFGKSEFVALDAIADAVDSCFEWPFSVSFRKESPSTTVQHDGLNTTVVSKTTQKGLKDRNLVIVGHNIGADLEYLQKLGSEVLNPPGMGGVFTSEPSTTKRGLIFSSILESLDTAIIYKYWQMEPQPRNLSYICSVLGVDAWLTHNAGNDARYTLEALVKMLIKARLDQDEGERKRNPESKGVIEDGIETEKMRRLDVKMEAARKKVLEQIYGTKGNSTTKHAATTTDIAGESGSIWSMPIHIKRPSQEKALEISMEEQVRRYNEANGPDDPSTCWATHDSQEVLRAPRAGW